MIDSFSPDGTGWARFSDDRTMRYRLGRKITPRTLGIAWPTLEQRCCEFDPDVPYGHRAWCAWGQLIRVVFVLINPSVADAFKPDRTATKCCQFAARWGADICEIVNLHPLIATDPRELYTRAALATNHDRWPTGCSPTNEAEITMATQGAFRVIAAWGTHGEFLDRGLRIQKMLEAEKVELMHLGLTEDGFPKHPLARGKHFIPLTKEPEIWGVR